MTNVEEAIVMLELKKLNQMWAEDSKIINDLDAATKKTAADHSKYLQLRAEATLHHAKLKRQLDTMMRDKFLYYNGKMNREQIEARGWAYDPFDGLRIMKTDMDKYYNADPDLQELNEKVVYWKTIIDTIGEIVEVLKWRHQSISNIIRWKTFEAGG